MHPEFEHQAQSVDALLSELGVGPEEASRVIQVWNKIDRLPVDERRALLEGNCLGQSCFPVSAVTGEGTEALLQEMDARLRSGERTAVLRLSYSDGEKRAWLFRENVVQHESSCDEGMELAVRWSLVQASRYRSLFGSAGDEEHAEGAPSERQAAVQRDRTLRTASTVAR